MEVDKTMDKQDRKSVSQKGVLLSVRPNWCELIASGKKTIEIRRSMPKLELPFRCFIYCTSVRSLTLADYVGIHAKTGGRVDDWSGKVIGEFTCNWIEPIHVYSDGGVQNWAYAETDRSGLTYEQVASYIGKEKTGYAWHISDLKLYDKSKHLDDFQKHDAPEPEDLGEELCLYCFETDYGDHREFITPTGIVSCEGSWCQDAYQEYLNYNGYKLARPPQSWCYVEVPE